MTPQEFKDRYLAGIKRGFAQAPQDIRAGLEEKLSAFTRFPLEMLDRFKLSASDRRFLSEVGLPQAAAPALNFRNLYDLQPDFETHPFFKDFFVLGSASRHRLVAIDLESNEVVCFDLAEEDAAIEFVNSSLEKLAGCLCLFQEHRDRNEMDTCFEAMAEVDPGLAQYGSFWEEETHNFFDNILERLNEAARRNRE
jgi:SUKH-4 immunity protein